MKYVFTALIAVVAVMFVAASATADWKWEDGHKMHFPQRPDHDGWDVKFGPFVIPQDPEPIQGIKVLADDWKCSQTGNVEDIHFWFSARGDDWTPDIPFQNIHYSIWSNEPAVVDDLGNELEPSRPKDLLHWGDSANGDFSYKLNPEPGTGQQGWYDPNLPIEPGINPIDNDHLMFWQMNITDIVEPFEQKRGEIYWLDLYVVAGVGGTTNIELGWKTADTERYPNEFQGKHFMDDAFWGHLAPDTAGGDPLVEWMGPLMDPWTGESLDLAFVITPEPGTVVMLLGAGLMGLLAYARRRRKS